jgi:hypothetical protein
MKPSHHRLSRRSSAELLRKNHPYSSSTDDDSDSGLVNDRQEMTPQLPPRRGHIKRNSGHRPCSDGSYHDPRQDDLRQSVHSEDGNVSFNSEVRYLRMSLHFYFKVNHI